MGIDEVSFSVEHSCCHCLLIYLTVLWKVCLSGPLSHCHLFDSEGAALHSSKEACKPAAHSEFSKDNSVGDCSDLAGTFYQGGLRKLDGQRGHNQIEEDVFQS